MKGILKKDLPIAKAGETVSLHKEELHYAIFDVNPVDPQMLGYILERDIPEWIEPIVEKKRYEDLKKGDEAWYIDGKDGCAFLIDFRNDCRSETFLTREEAEDEHKRREWAVRPDKFIPDIEEYYYCYNPRNPPFNTQSLKNRRDEMDTLIINSGLAFKSEIECREAIKEHDLIRLFYTVR